MLKVIKEILGFQSILEEVKKVKKIRKLVTASKAEVARIVVLLTIFTILLTLLAPTVSLFGQTGSPPEILNVIVARDRIKNQAERRIEYSQGLNIAVTDPDGLDNLFVDGEISIEIHSSDGNTYPKPEDEFVVKTWSGADPPYVTIQWYTPHQRRPVPSYTYEIIITDSNGMSTTYNTLPLVEGLFGAQVTYPVFPLIEYPVCNTVLIENYPVLRWRIDGVRGCMLEIGGPSVDWSTIFSEEYVASHLGSRNRLVYKYDGPSMIPGGHYNMFVFVYNDYRYSDVEVHTYTSIHEIVFVKYSNQMLVEMLEDLKGSIAALEPTDVPILRNDLDYLKNRLDMDADHIISLISDEANPTRSDYRDARVWINVIKTDLDMVIPPRNRSTSASAVFDLITQIDKLLGDVIGRYRP